MVQVIENAIVLHHVTLLFALLTFAVGTIAGFQGIVARIPNEWSMAVKTSSGILYVIVRGLLPAVCYVILHRMHLLASPSPWLEALLLGGGSETALRSRVLLTFKPPAPGQPPTEDSKGLLDFVFWFQQFFIERASNDLALQRMEEVSHYFDPKPPKPPLNLKNLTDGVQTYADALGDQSALAKTAATTTLADYTTAFPVPTVPIPPSMERNWCLKLGFALYKELNLNNYRALARRITQ